MWSAGTSRMLKHTERWIREAAPESISSLAARDRPGGAIRSEGVPAHHRRVTMTDAGLVLLERGRDILSEIYEAEDAARALTAYPSATRHGVGLR
jgi:hypothetical protein